MKSDAKILSLSKNDFMRTKIIASMKQLLLKTPYDKLTVTCICEHAGISRSSFYHLFTDVDDALDWEFGRLLSEAMEQHPIAGDWRKDSANISTAFLNHATEEGLVYRKIALNMSRVDYNSIFSRTRRRFVRMYTNYIERWRNDLLDERCIFEINFFVCGTSDMLADWMANQKEPPEIVSRKTTQCMPPYLASVLDQCSEAYRAANPQ